MGDAPDLLLVQRQHHHPTLREHLVAMEAEQHPPIFEPSDDVTLRRLAELLAEADLYSIDVGKVRNASNAAQFSTYYDCSVISRTSAAAEPEEYGVHWAPVGTDQDPRTGFGAGPDSAVIGHFPRSVTPDDWRTSALLLIVTTPFVHLSASNEAQPTLVQGALEVGLGGYRYLELMPG